MDYLKETVRVDIGDPPGVAVGTVKEYVNLDELETAKLLYVRLNKDRTSLNYLNIHECTEYAKEIREGQLKEYLAEMALSIRLDSPVQWGIWKDEKTIEITVGEVTIMQRSNIKKRASISRGTMIKEINVHSGMNPFTKKVTNEIRDLHELEFIYPETKSKVDPTSQKAEESKWCHALGKTNVTYRGKKFSVQVHWYEHPNIGACGRDTKANLDIEFEKGEY